MNKPLVSAARRKLFLGMLAMAPAAVWAEDGSYPSHPIRIVVGYSPGGGTDIMARIIAPALGTEFKQSVYIENRPGASGTIGANLIAHANPDGYTVMMGVVSLNAVLPSLYSNLPYDTAKDFIPVTLVASVPHIVAVNPSLPVHTLAELIDYAKSHPNALSFPSAGTGTTPHLAGEIFKHLTDTQMLHVPYKSAGQSLPDLLSGVLQVSFDTCAATKSLVLSGHLRALAVTSAVRLPDLPDVPTVAEAGLPDFRISTWYGLFVPKNTPKDIVALLHDKAATVMAKSDVQSQLRDNGADGSATPSAEAFADLVHKDAQRYGEIVKAAHITLQ